MFIPQGFAHGYITLSEHSIVNMYANTPWDKENQRCICWNDASIGIDWPLFPDYPVIVEPLVSDKDMLGQPFAHAEVYD